MSSSILEIIELENGDIVLQYADGEGEPLVNIRFSEEAKSHIEDSSLDIAKIMIQAGIQAAAHLDVIADSDELEPVISEADESASHTLH